MRGRWTCSGRKWRRKWCLVSSTYLHVLVFAPHIDMYLCLYFLHTLLAFVLLHWRNVLNNFRLLNGKWRVSLVGEKNNEVDTCDLDAELSARSAHFCLFGKALATSALFWQKKSRYGAGTIHIAKTYSGGKKTKKVWTSAHFCRLCPTRKKLSQSLRFFDKQFKIWDRNIS